MDSLPENQKNQVQVFFDKYYPTKEQHYWSVTKLFAHAMYIPMFLQIGLHNVAKGKFSKLVYIDTHSGPGLAKIGGDERDIVLGSALLALHWPRVVASQVPQFKNIARGFDELHFIELSWRNTNILRKFVNSFTHVKVYTDDANRSLPRIPVDERALVYLFVDPYGELDSQLSYDALSSFVARHRADIMMSVFASHLARGFSSISRIDLLKERVERIFGPGFCTSTCPGAQLLCSIGAATRDAVLEAFKCLLRKLGYQKVVDIPVRFEKGILYYMVLATKGSGGWIDGYIDYISNKAPKDYETLKKLWLRATGRLVGLDNFF
ncbi:three-Cys-motif partner protein TcmP [Pyrodictium abyssi]